jgi:predicted O-methyltransferase YrrM
MSENPYGPSLLEKLQGVVSLGFVPPPFDGMQIYSRLKFLHDCILQHASCSSGEALEIGCYKGCSTIFLAKACLKKGIRKIYAVDLFTGTPSWKQDIDTQKSTKQRLKSYGLEEAVTLIRGDSRTQAWDRAIDVLHLDGDHTYEAILGDLRKYVAFLTPGGIVIVDDYDSDHAELKKAVHETLIEYEELELVDVHRGGRGVGSICLRKKVGG